MASVASATDPPALFIVMTIPVFGPGAGETTPEIRIGAVPEYEGEFVWTEMV